MWTKCLKQRFTIPLDRLRSRVRRQIVDVVKAVFATGIESLFLIHAHTGSTGDRSENWNPGLQKRFRPRVAIAKTPSRIWRQLIKDWAGDGLRNAEDNPILTATSAKARVLNGIAQQMRQRSALIGMKGLKVDDCVLHDNYRIIFDSGHRKYGTEPKDLGTITGVGSKRITVRLDNGRRVDIAVAESPPVSLAYALAHPDAEKLKSPGARVLFEGRDPVREMAAINEHHSKRRLLVYTTKANAGHFAAWGFARLRDQFLDEARSQHTWEESWRAKLVDAEKQRAEEDRRREEKRKQEEELRRQREQERAEQARSQSQDHSH